jgi:hypothetical protein
VLNVFSGSLLSVPKGNLFEVFEIPNSLLTNPLEKRANKEALEK